MLGIPIGVRLLVYTDASVMKTALGVFLLVFGTYALLAPRLHTVTAGGRVADAGIGFIGGILGGIGGYSGVLPTIWTQLRGWPKEIARAVYQPYVIIIQAIALAGIVWVTLDRAGLIMLVAVLPPLLLRHLDRLAALRPHERPALPPGAGRAADRLGRDAGALGQTDAARYQGSRGAQQDALYPRAQAAAARHQAGLRAAAR